MSNETLYGTLALLSLAIATITIFKIRPSKQSRDAFRHRTGPVV